MTARTIVRCTGVGDATSADAMMADVTTVVATMTAATTMAATVAATAMPPAAKIGDTIRSIVTMTPSTSPCHANKHGCVWGKDAAYSNLAMAAVGPT